MLRRTSAAWLLVPALIVLAALPVAAQSASTGTSGAIATIYPATSTAPEEIAVSTVSGIALYALSAQTAYSLTAAGLGSGAPAVDAADLAVGESVDVTPASSTTGTATNAAAIAIGAQITIGQVSALSTAAGQPLGFDVASGGQTSAFVEAADAVTAPTGVAPAVDQGVVVYSLSQGGTAATAYVVDLAGALPTFGGTIASANGAALVLTTASGALSFAYSASTPVSVGTTATGDGYLLAGASATVSLAAGAGGASATAITLAPTTVQGTITAVASPSAGVTDLTVSLAGGSDTVVVLSSTNLGGAALAQFAPNASVTATGVLVGTTMTATALSLGAEQATGTVSAVAAGTSFQVQTASGAMTFVIASGTTFDVGTYAATDAYLMAGQTVAVTYQSGMSAGQTVDTATAVTITPQTLSGTVGPSPSATAFAVAGPSGTVDVTVAPDAAVSGSVAQGASVSLTGVSLSASAFEAFSVDVQSGASEPPSASARVVAGRIGAVTAQSLTVTTESGASVALAITANTGVRLGRMTAPLSLLMAGEWVRVRVAPDPTTAGQADAVTVYLLPRTAVGIVESVATGPTGTVLTLRGRMVGRLVPMAVGRGKGENGIGKVEGARILTVTVPQGVTLAGGATFQTGQAIAAEGALAGQGLVASQVWLVVAPSAPSHGPGDGASRGKQDRQGGHSGQDQGQGGKQHGNGNGNGRGRHGDR